MTQVGPNETATMGPNQVAKSRPVISGGLILEFAESNWARQLGRIILGLGMAIGATSFISLFGS